MTRKPYILPLIFLLLAAIGCKNRNEAPDARLVISDSIMTARPDSMLEVLSAIEHEELKSDYDKALHTLLLTIATDKCYLPIQNDSALRAAVETFHYCHDLLNEAKARYYAGWAEAQATNYQKALRESLHAIDLAQEAQDTFWMARAHDLAREIYMKNYDPKNGAEEAGTAAFLFLRAGARDHYKYAKLDQVEAFLMPTLTSESLECKRVTEILDSLELIAASSNDSIFMADCLMQKAFLHSKLGDHHAAEHSLNSMLQFNNNGYQQRNSVGMRIKIAESKGEPVKGYLKYLDCEPQTRQDSIFQLSVQEMIAVNDRDWKWAYEISDSLAGFSAKILGDHSYNSIQEVKDIYNQDLLQDQKMENHRLENSRNLGWIAVVLLVIVSTSTLFLILKRNKRAKDKVMEEILTLTDTNRRLSAKVADQENLKTANDNLRSEKDELMGINRALQKMTDTLNSDIKSSQLKISDLRDLNDKLLAEVMILQERIQKNGEEDKEKNWNTHQKRMSVFGNKIDAICNLAMEYFGVEAKEAFKKDLYNRANAELKSLKSEKNLEELEKSIDEMNDNILTRMREQLPKIMKKHHRWIALMIGGLEPKTISFLLDMKLQTYYVKRLRVKERIEKSDCVDKMDFLRYFP